MRKLTQKPVRYVVNTHWHNDHVHGNEVYRETWPAVQFIGHSNTRKDAIAQAWGSVEQGRKQYGEAAERMERWLSTGKDDTGNAIDDARRKRIESRVAYFRLVLTETGNLKPTPPDVTLEDSLVLHRGARTIEIRFLGRGNTRGDVVVFLPKEKIVATGDLVVSPAPFGFGSYYEEWIKTLDKLTALGATTYIPGHGTVMSDTKYIDSLRGLLRALTSEVAAAVARGATLEETVKSVTLDDWKKVFAEGLAGGFIAPAVERTWRQAKREPAALE